MDMLNNKNQESKLELLNAIENAILDYGRKHRGVITNPYRWFAERLGYKAKNQIYFWFQKRESSLIKVEELIEIIEITQDKSIVDALNKRIQDVLK